MPGSLADSILKFLADNPPSKASEIARALGEERSAVNAALYGPLRGKVEQDSSYRWSLAQRTRRDSEPTQVLPETSLAKLAAYYLDCIGLEGADEVSVFARSKWPEYAELSSNPLASTTDSLQDSAAQQVLRKTRNQNGPLNHYVGFPVLAKHFRSRKGWEGYFLEPLFLVQIADGELDEGAPQLNLKAIESLTGATGSAVIEEAVSLITELGLDQPQGDLPELDELLARLHHMHPEWQWREHPDPDAVSQDPPLADVTQPGLYNRVIAVSAERSMYTKGLEVELANLRKLQKPEYSNTALGRWLTEVPPAISIEDEPLLEPLPLNSEQRQAVQQALTNQLTVITGPPGTGKSQVVSSILMNAAWQGMTTLFVSKNNKAVDVVEERVNGIGTRPVVLRLGRGEFQTRLSNYLTQLLAASATTEDKEAYREEEAAHDELQGQIRKLRNALDEVIALRNRVDQLDQEADEARNEFGKELDAALAADFNRLESALDQVETILERVDPAQRGLMVSLIWFAVRKKRWEAVPTPLTGMEGAIQAIGIRPPDDSNHDVRVWREWLAFAHRRIGLLQEVDAYREALDELRSRPSLEAIAVEASTLTEELAGSSERLWRGWLKLQPARLTSELRRILGEYSAVLELRAQADATGGMVDTATFRKYHRLFPEVVQALPCWAITSLSVRSRVPFDPGFFDLLLVDEASQCDIASLIPLLYRARRVAVIGDPMQLRHVSTLTQAQDRQLLSKHDLMDRVSWSYSTRSAFDLAAALCRSEDIVNLRDHHRSHADIVQFSNEQFYDGRLRIVTKYSNLLLRRSDDPVVRWIDVPGEVTRPPDGGAVNVIEAEAVVGELRRVVLEQGYEGSVGVVSPFRAHAVRIKDIIEHDRVLKRELDTRGFIADTVHKFQGDERDLMIFSPVISRGAHKGAYLFLRNNPNLFNVAVTRARAALVVVGDRSAAHDSGVDYLSRFSEYVLEVDSQRPAEEEVSAQHDLGPTFPQHLDSDVVSPWEKQLYEALHRAGIPSVPQHPVEAYRLDLAVFHAGRRLDIEVDGERFHRAWNGELARRDQLRTQRLIELGWDVRRFWVYEVRDDIESCVARVQEWRDSIPAQ